MSESKETSVGRILDTFPPAFLVLASILGIILIFLSPVNFFLPSIIRSPFEGTSSSAEILGRFTLIVLMSIIIGTPVSFLETLFVGNLGVNHHIHDIVCQLRLGNVRSLGLRERLKGIGYDKRQQKVDETHDFWRRLKKKGLVVIYDSLVTQNEIVNGLLVGSEIAVVFDILGAPFLLVYWFIVGTLDYWELFVAIFLISLLLLVYIRWINGYWKPKFQDQIEGFRQKWKAELEGDCY